MRKRGIDLVRETRGKKSRRGESKSRDSEVSRRPREKRVVNYIKVRKKKNHSILFKG